MCGDRFSLLLGIYRGAKMLGHMGTLCKAFGGTAKLFTKVAAPVLHSHWQSTRVRVFPLPCQFLLLPVFLVIHLSVFLIFISLVTNHLCICLLLVSISTLGKCLFKSFVYFKNSVICLFIIELYAYFAYSLRCVIVLFCKFQSR